MELAQMILSAASEDIPKAGEIRVILKVCIIARSFLSSLKII
jgi:hypothetical protein